MSKRLSTLETRRDTYEEKLVDLDKQISEEKAKILGEKASKTKELIEAALNYKKIYGELPEGFVMPEGYGEDGEVEDEITEQPKKKKKNKKNKNKEGK